MTSCPRLQIALALDAARLDGVRAGLACGPVDAGVFLTYAGDGQFFRHGEPVVTDAQLGAAVREIARLFYEGSQRRW